MPKLYQHEDTGRMTWAATELDGRWFKVPTMYEDDLPEMTDDEYSKWFEDSCVIDGVRMGPAI